MVQSKQEPVEVSGQMAVWLRPTEDEMIEISADAARHWLSEWESGDGICSEPVQILRDAIELALPPQRTHTIMVELTTEQRDAWIAGQRDTRLAGIRVGTKLVKACRASRGADDE